MPHPARLLVVVASTAVLALSSCGSRSGTEPAGDETSTTAASGGPMDAPGAASLVGSWTLESYTGSGGTAPAATNASPATLTFATPPTLNGTTGCNSFSGTYSAGGTSLTITLGPMTQMACTDPGANAQERAVLDGLPRVTAADVGRDRLTLSGSAGEILFVYTRAKADLAGSRWTATGVNNGKDAVVSTEATSNLTAEFSDDAKVTGSGGCNTFGATYTEGPGTVSITGLASTKMSCSAEVDALEQQYFTALQASTTFDVRGDVLTLRDGSGAMQVVFARAS